MSNVKIRSPIRIAQAGVASIVFALALTATTAAAPNLGTLKTVGGVPTLPLRTANAVVATGPFANSTMPIVVRNMSKEIRSGITVTATAYVGGRLVATGSDQGMFPDIVYPGGLAIGHVYFRSNPPAGATFKFDVRGRTGKGSTTFGKASLTITTANYSSDGHLVGIGRNASKTRATGPLSVYAACFSVESKLLAMENGFSDAEEAPPGATAPFTLDFSSYGTETAPSCAKILVAMSGYKF